MIKTLTSYLDYSLFAESSVAIFAIVFAAIVFRTLAIRTEVADQHARIVLGDTRESLDEQ